MTRQKMIPVLNCLIIAYGMIIFWSIFSAGLIAAEQSVSKRANEALAEERRQFLRRDRAAINAAAEQTEKLILEIERLRYVAFFMPIVGFFTMACVVRSAWSSASVL